MSRRHVAFIAAATIGLAACSGEPPPAPTITVTAPNVASESAPTADPAPGSTSAQPVAPDPRPAESTAEPPRSAAPEPGAGVPEELGAAVDKREIVDDGDRLLLEVYPLRREGKVAVFNARLTYLDVQGGANRFLLSGPELGREATGTPTEITLTDAKAGKLHLPARDAEDRALCAPNLAADAATGTQVVVSCLFGAPPASTTAVDVTVGPFGAFHGVPIQ